MDDTRPCLTCKTTPGRYISEAFTYTDSVTGAQRHYDRTDRPCYSCKGTASFPAPDAKAIGLAIKGRDPRKLCSKRPKDARAYYVWRNARFHGGADVTMPMGASMEVSGDPYRKELDVMADIVARAVFGTDLAAAHRWGRAMGVLNTDLPGLPARAYPGASVADGDKPIEEANELS